MSKPKIEICHDPTYLQRYLEEELDESQEQAVREHIDSCQDCQSRLEKIAANQSMWDGIRDMADTQFHSSNRSPSPEGPEKTDSRLQQLIKFLAPTDDPDMLGRLGTYEVVGLIGQGSTGIVLKAFEPRLNRFVAIKVLSPIYSSNGAARKRFEREGRAVAAVLHQNVVPIYSVAEYNGLPYIVMQYVAGLSLLQRIEKNGPLETCEVVRIGMQVAQGLAAAHQQGIVHRDVKPANVILENSVDRAMVTDFGLARVADDASMTRSGTIAGTPQYMSPEQAKGEAIDSRSDLFSLGSLMYAACTGRPPFRAETIFGVINRVCQAEPRSILEINPNIDPWLVHFINRLITKSPAERFQTCDEVVDALAAELAFSQNPTSAPRPKRDWMPKSALAKPHGKSKTKPAKRPIGLMVTAASLLIVAMTWIVGNELSDGAMMNQFVAMFAVSSPQQPEKKLEVGQEKITWKQNQQEFDSNSIGTFDQKLDRLFELKQGGMLQLDLQAGNVTILPSELENRVTVSVLRRVEASSQEEAEKILSNHQLDFDSNDEKLTLGAKLKGDKESRLSKKIKRIKYRITVPRKMNAIVETRAGNLAFGELAGDIEAKTHHGDIEFAKIDGEVFAESTAGDINITDGCTKKVDLFSVNGDIYAANLMTSGRIRTSGGDVWLGKSPGSVRVQTSGGHVKVNGVDGETGAYACDGSVIVRMMETPKNNCRFSAARGQVQMLVADQVAMNLQTRGEVKSDLEFVSTKDEETDIQWSSSELNGGGKRVRAISSGGEVTVKILDNASQAVVNSLGGSGLGGSGLSGRGKKLSKHAIAKTTGPVRPGAIATVELEGSNDMDGYTLYLPESHDKTKGPYPVLVYLQGAYGVGGEISGINNWGMPRMIRDEQNLSIERNKLLLDTFIVVSPHIKSGQYYSHPDVITKILGDVQSKYNGDPSRVYLTGLSRGGHGTWGLAERLPNTFAAVVPIAGNPESVKDFGKLKGTSVWIAHNLGDSSVNFSDVERAAKRIEKANDVQFLRIETSSAAGTDYINQTHILTSPNSDSHDAWTDMYTSVEFYKWLLKQKREKPGSEVAAN